MSPDGVVLADVGVEPLLKLLVYPLHQEMTSAAGDDFRCGRFL